MGTSARNQLVMNPKSTVWGFMNLIGRPFSDPFVQQEVKQLPYEIVQHGKDGVGIKVMYCLHEGSCVWAEFCGRVL